jgi:hypothetical protein
VSARADKWINVAREIFGLREQTNGKSEIKTQMLRNEKKNLNVERRDEREF